MTRNLEPVFPRRLVQGKREMRDILTTRITNYRTQQSASGEAFQVVNGCAAHHSGQLLMFRIWLTFGDGAKCDKIENNCSFTISSHGVFPYPDVHHSLVCLAFGH